MRFRRALLPALMAAGLLAFALVPAVHADNFGLSTAGSAAGLSGGTTDPAALAGKIIKGALGFVGTLFLLLLIYGGFTYMTARGDSKKVDTAKGLIVSAIIGVAIIASAYAVTSFVLAAATGGQTTTAAPAAPPASNSVPIGGDCTTSDQCTPAATTVCDKGKCVSTIE